MSEVQVRRTGGDNPGEGGVVWNYVVPRSWILLCSKASSEWRWVGEGRAARSFRSDRSSSVLFSFLFFSSFLRSFLFLSSFFPFLFLSLFPQQWEDDIAVFWGWDDCTMAGLGEGGMGVSISGSYLSLNVLTLRCQLDLRVLSNC